MTNGETPFDLKHALDRLEEKSKQHDAVLRKTQAIGEKWHKRLNKLQATNAATALLVYIVLWALFNPLVALCVAGPLGLSGFALVWWLFERRV